MTNDFAFVQERAERLRHARIAAGYESASAAAEAMGVAIPTYLGHENGSSGFRTPSAIKYAAKFRVSLEWLETGRGDDPAIQPSNSTRSIPDIETRPLIGAIQAGVWQEPFESGDSELIEIPTPADRIVSGANQYWLEIVGDSVDQFVGNGSRVFCTAVWDWARDTDDLFRRANGKLVIAERRRSDGTFQRTCKRLVTQNAKTALHPASNHPRWKNEAPIPLNENGDTTSVEIVAVVTDLLVVAP